MYRKTVSDTLDTESETLHISEVADIRRTFYRETKELNDRFKERDEGYFGKKDLSYYYKDRLVICDWQIKNDKIYGSYFLYLNNGTDSFEVDHF